MLPSEKNFEEFIELYLTSCPILGLDGKPIGKMEYEKVAPSEYDKDYCVVPSELVAFLKETQPKEWKKLVDGVGGNEQQAVRSLLSRLDTELKRGTLSVLRSSYFDAGYGAHFRMVYFKPVNNKTPEHEQWYMQNRLGIMRQLRYSKVNDNSIDMAIFLNGLPVVTIELKNSLTGQDHHNAIKQYMQDRPIAGEKLLEFQRCLVHFAMGTEQVYMTTCLNGAKTRFFPFNKCFQNQGLPTEGYRVDYMWEDVLRRDSLLDLIQNYINLQTNVEKEYNDQKHKIEEKTSQALIFPRYHQRRAVRKLIKDVKENGAGRRYLIQHSAGSGKSNTITWLAFRLSNLFQHYDDDKALFDCVLVVTDKRVLDRQIQNNIRQFQITDGEVAYIDKNCTSQDLKAAIEQRKRIVVTTLQKFPVIADSIELFPDRKYAVIIDEAHSSQSGEAARQMRKALSLDEAEAFDAQDERNNDDEDRLNAIIENEIERKGFKKNISFFAFTATPKDKTIEIFCEKEHGTQEPFDLYSMEEAIKEGFILDVMKQYMSFKRYFKLVHASGVPDKEYDRKKSVRLLGNYVDLQDAAIEKKARIMIEHFVSSTADEIQGKARAMLVTRSRLHAVRFKRKFDEVMQEMRLPYGALVAFSGTVKDEETGLEYTEKSMNNLEGNVSIPDALKLPKFRILIVANKYQTGFDEPLLHTMFVDKKLGGTSTVQTLSRLNRCRKGKDSTMVIDFVNDPEKVQADFQRYYGMNFITEENATDPNSIYDVKSRVRDFDVVREEDVNAFAKIFFSKNQQQEKLYGILNPACDYAISHLDDDQMELFRKTCRSFCNLYKFLCQIITFKDAELEKMYVFLLALGKLLPYRKQNLPLDVLNETELESYKLQYQYTTNLQLTSNNYEGRGQQPGGVVAEPEVETDWLSNIIKTLNETFGLDLTEEDKVDLKRLKDKIMSNEELLSYFTPDNTRDNIRTKFDEEVDSELLEFVNGKLELYNKLTEDKANAMFKRVWFTEVYDRLVRGMK